MSRQGHERAGRLAEAAAAWLLRLKGFRILARRYATPLGEIDLVARRRGLVVFVEVKRRADLAAASEAILPRQRQRIARAAELFLQRHAAARGAGCRFDVIAVAPWRWPLHLEDAWRL
ncbi:MAG: YraN family protein [Geminicoccaceae bacterium]